jgi:hypothetical protein
MVGKCNNYVVEDDLIPPQSPGEGLQVMNFAQYLHIVLVIGSSVITISPTRVVGNFCINDRERAGGALL